jgi:hypothetical protein
MALAKKGQIHQIVFPMVDGTDFATLETTITVSDFNSGATCKFFGWDTGVSTATTSGTISKIASLVTSGIFRKTLKSTENNYDNMLVKITKTGCAPQILEWANVNSDDSDLMSALTVIQSMASDAASAATQANSRILLTQSQASDIASYLVGISGMLSDAHSAAAAGSSRALLNQSRISDVYSMTSNLLSRFESVVSDANVQFASDVSDIASAVHALLVSDLSDIKSAAQQTNSRTLVVQSRVSDVQSFLSDFQSDLLSHVDTTGVQLNASTMSDLRSAINALTVSLDASNISDIASAVVAALPISSQVSDIYSLLSDLNSQFLSRVPKETAARSQLSDLSSDMMSVLTQTGVQLNASTMSDLRSAVDAATLDASDLSDIASAVMARTLTAPTGVISATPTVADALAWLATMSRNKITQTATKGKLFADNEITVIASSIDSDDTTTATRGEWG